MEAGGTGGGEYRLSLFILESVGASCSVLSVHFHFFVVAVGLLDSNKMTVNGTDLLWRRVRNKEQIESR